MCSDVLQFKEKVLEVEGWILIRGINEECIEANLGKKTDLKFLTVTALLFENAKWNHSRKSYYTIVPNVCLRIVKTIWFITMTHVIDHLWFYNHSYIFKSIVSIETN